MKAEQELRTVQPGLAAFREQICWSILDRRIVGKVISLRAAATPEVPPADRAKNRSLFFDDLLDAKLREFNSRCTEAEGALFGLLRHLNTDIHGTGQVDSERFIYRNILRIKLRDLHYFAI